MTERITKRRSHPLLGAFPLSVMTLATFLVIFTVLMARLTSGADPALHRAGSASTLVESSSGVAPLKTRASGGVASGAASAASGASNVAPAAAEGSGQATPALVTRSSGAAAGSVGRDD